MSSFTGHLLPRDNSVLSDKEPEVGSGLYSLPHLRAGPTLLPTEMWSWLQSHGTDSKYPGHSCFLTVLSRGELVGLMGM